jgi:4a-hydroxytetrahydrobiopterin dehydratase
MTATELAARRCVPCQGGVAPLRGAALQAFAEQLGRDWLVIEEHHIEKTYRFKNFREALVFTNAAGEIAEAQGHHPEIVLNWGRVTVRVWTHKINGLTESDFVLAAKIEQMSLAGQGTESVPGRAA